MTAANKTPAYYALATMDELNAYLKTAKKSKADAETIRAKWTAARAGIMSPAAAEVAAPTEALVLSGDMKEIPLQDGKAVVPEAPAAVSVTDPALAQQPEAKANAQSWPDVKPRAKKSAAAAVIESIAKAEPGLTTRFIDPRLIDVKDDWNARTDFGDLEDLAAQILVQKRIDGHGLLNDIRVQEKDDGSGRFWLVDGERRYQAVMGLIDGGESFDIGIPAKVEPADAKTDELIVKMFLANEGKPLLPYEEGMYFKRLQTEYGMTSEQIEAKTGCSATRIWYGLALVNADDDLVDAIRKGTVGLTVAKSIAVNARGDKAKQKELTAKAKAAKGDNKKTAALKKELDDIRRDKAAKERPALALKARKADEAEIAAMGAKVAARLKDVMEAFGLDHDTDMMEWVSNDRELQIAANFGALQVLKAVMGMKVKVEF